MPIHRASSSSDRVGPRKQSRPSRIDSAPLMKASTRSEVAWWVPKAETSWKTPV